MHLRCLKLATLLGIAIFATASVSPGQQNRQQSLTLSEVQAKLNQNLTRMRNATVAVRVGTNRASGFIVDKQFVVTTGHAVSKTGQPATVVLNNGTELESTVHGIDKANDVALLKLKLQTDIHPVAMHESRSGSSPQFLIAIGHPSGFDPDRPALVRFGTGIGGRIFQTSCCLARGDSGGPLFNLDGKVVGIHKQIVKGADGNYHASAARVLSNWRELTAGKVVSGPTRLPVRTKWKLASPPKLMKFASTVVEIWCDDKLAAMGTVIKTSSGQVILTKASELNGQPVVSLAGQKADAEIVRIDYPNDVAILQTTAKWLKNIDLENGSAVKPGTLVVSRLPGQNANRLGIAGAFPREIPADNGTLGVLLDGLTVTEVQPNSAAKLSGIRRGDKLTRLHTTKLNSQADLGAALRKLNAGDRIRIGLNRKGKEQTLPLQLLHPATRRFDDKTFQKGVAGKSSPRRGGFAKVVQHDCDLKPVECGGPLFDLKGNFLGINIARVGREAVYLLPASELKAIIQRSVK